MALSTRLGSRRLLVGLKHEDHTSAWRQCRGIFTAERRGGLHLAPAVCGVGVLGEVDFFFFFLLYSDEKYYLFILSITFLVFGFDVCMSRGDYRTDKPKFCFTTLDR